MFSVYISWQILLKIYWIHTGFHCFMEIGEIFLKQQAPKKQASMGSGGWMLPQEIFFFD